jgi:hypothetical protein
MKDKIGLLPPSHLKGFKKPMMVFVRVALGDIKKMNVIVLVRTFARKLPEEWDDRYVTVSYE